MLVGLYSAATGLEAAERMHEVISENLAHASVPGYRATVVSHETFEQAYQGTMDQPSPQGHGTHVAEYRTDFSGGPTAHTGRSLDVSLGGEGFFELDGPEGPLYTRNGVFFLDSDGRLINREGMSVMGTGGPISLPANASSEDVQIAPDGTVSAGRTTVGQIKRVAFADPGLLVRAGTTLFKSPAGIASDETDTRVMQGSRELSNVSAVTELVRMIVGTRHYEAAQKAISTMDEAIGQVTDPQT